MATSSYFFYDSGSTISRDDMYIERNNYYYQLNEWEEEQLTILSMFTNTISSKPELKDDYDEAVRWLNMTK